jgi:hypothetical protein
VPYGHPIVNIGATSVGSTANLFQGYWSHVEFRQGGYDQAAPKYDAAKKDMYLGVVQEGVLEVSREDNEYMGTQFPRVIELLSPASVGLKFSGEIGELHENNLHLMLGEDIESANNFIYPGAACAFDDVFGSLRCLRKRCDGFVMEVVLLKTIGSGGFSIGGAAEVIGSAAEFTALDDSGGDFGGSSDVPLGWIYAPDPAAGSTVPGTVLAA